MEKKEIEKDVNKVSERLEEATGGKEMAKKVKENSNKHGFIKC